MRLLLLFVLLPCFTWGQDNSKPMDPINRLFEGMKAGDSAMVHSAFHHSQTLSTVSIDSKTGQPVLRSGTLADFLKAIGTAHAEPYNELIWSPKIEIDGNFAQVWVNYAFYSGKTFRHCGVDAFHLFRNQKAEWKIFGLADTRQTMGCKVPKEVSDRVK